MRSSLLYPKYCLIKVDDFNRPLLIAFEWLVVNFGHGADWATSEY